MKQVCLSLSDVAASLRRSPLVDALGWRPLSSISHLTASRWVSSRGSGIVIKNSWCQNMENMWLSFTTAWKVFIFGVFLVHVFPHWDCIWRDTPYLSVFSLNVRKCGPEKLQIRTIFTQCTRGSLWVFCKILEDNYLIKHQWLLAMNICSKNSIAASCRSHLEVFPIKVVVNKNSCASGLQEIGDTDPVFLTLPFQLALQWCQNCDWSIGFVVQCLLYFNMSSSILQQLQNGYKNWQEMG